MSILALKTALARKRSAAKKLSDACIDAKGEYRDMTPEEKSSFDALVADVAKIKEQMEKLSAIDDEDDDECEDEDESVDEPVRSAKGGKGGGRRSEPIDQRSAPAVHVQKHVYSLLRAMRANLDKRPQTGLEGEVHQELMKTTSRKAEGFLMPLGNEVALRELLRHSFRETRDLTTTTGQGAVFVEPMLPFIELLRNKIVLRKMGAALLTGMEGKFSIPRQTQAASAAWIAEGVALTPTNQALDQVPFVSKTLGAATNISRKFIYQSSVDAESFVQNDLAKQLAIAFDYAGINGSGVGAIPIGILQNSIIQTNSAGLSPGVNGDLPTYGMLVDMETQVASLNADQGDMAYLMAPAVKGTLKQTPKIAASPSYPVFLWDDGPTPGLGEVNGQPAWSTNQVPVNGSKGTGTNLGSLIFGYFPDLIMAQWGGIDVVVNPFSNQLSGAITISMLTEADVEIRHPESFAIVQDLILDAY